MGTEPLRPSECLSFVVAPVCFTCYKFPESIGEEDEVCVCIHVSRRGAGLPDFDRPQEPFSEESPPLVK